MVSSRTTVTSPGAVVITLEVDIASANRVVPGDRRLIDDARGATDLAVGTAPSDGIFGVSVVRHDMFQLEVVDVVLSVNVEGRFI